MSGEAPTRYRTRIPRHPSDTANVHSHQRAVWRGGYETVSAPGILHITRGLSPPPNGRDPTTRGQNREVDYGIRDKQTPR